MVPRPCYMSADMSSCGTYRFKLDRRWESEFVRRTILFFRPMRSGLNRHGNGEGRRYSRMRRRIIRILPVVGLNPSTADWKNDDATIRRVMSFANSWGYQGIIMLNLFAIRSKDPAILKTTTADPIGPNNDGVLLVATAPTWYARTRQVLCAWGAHGTFMGRGVQVWNLLKSEGRELVCLGTTANGHPLHPLRLRGDLVPVPFARPAV